MRKLMIALLCVLGLNANDGIKVFTENYPPYNMDEKGKLTGISVDVLEAMYKKMGYKEDRQSFKLTSWSRAYSMAQKKKNCMVFSTTRTAKREPLFKWVGPIIKTTVGITAPKSKNIVINNVSDLNKYKIGAVMKDIGEQLLNEKGVDKKSIKSVSGKNAIKMSYNKMEKNRIDMFAYEINVAKHSAKSSGFDVNNYEVVYTLKEGELFFAFNKKTKDSIIQKWQKALDDIKADGTYDKILEKY
jgi:ABC-type amino acid transport substrate-binding protein